jgi:transposase
VTSPRRIVIGIDTHLDTIHVAAITEAGKTVADREFATTPTGYYIAVRWAQSFGEVLAAGVEGTSSYGSGITQTLQDNDIEVFEVTRPDRAGRRKHGKSDPLDAYSAARAVLAGNGLATPKDPNTAALRALQTARRGAVKARTAAINQIKALLVTAPPELRERYRRYTTTTTLITALIRCRPSALGDTTSVTVLTACKALAQRIDYLERQDRELTEQLDALVWAINPDLRAAYGVGPDTAAQLLITAGTNTHRLRSEAAFARLCGAAPIPASSGKITRHRLSRGGDRDANNALHRIALVRWSHDPRTRDYAQRKLADGRSKKDILRLLKRAIAREIFKRLTAPSPIDDYSDLRPARQAKNITLATAATHLGVRTNDISRLERGLKRDDTLAANYRTWLATQLITAA